MIRRAAVVTLAFASSCATLIIADTWEGDFIKVPHARHAGAKVDCINCHEDVYDAQSLDANYRPAEAKCMECHQEEKDKGNCIMCHTDPKRARAYPKRDHEVKFAHKPHIEKVKEDCSVCHKSLPDPSRHKDYAPAMASCLRCHNHREDYDNGRCNLCHNDLSRYPLKPVADFSHQGNWVREHSRDARASVATCATCHDQTFCADCHAKTVATRVEIKYSEKVASDFIHRDDYVPRHMLDAKSDPTRCARCHGTSFCDNCHTAQNLTPHAANPRDPHPAGWAFPASPQFHGPEARSDISQCAPCHDQGPRSICINCHKVGGIGGNPHPTGFTDRHPHAEIQKNGMCLYCHQ